MVDKVTADHLNIRVDSAVDAFTPGYLHKNQEIEVISRGKKWLEITSDFQYTPTATPEELHLNNTGKLFISSQYVEQQFRNLSNDYFETIALIHLLSFIFLLSVNYRNFIHILWFRVFSIQTIPQAFAQGFILLYKFLNRPAERAAQGQANEVH